MASRVLTNTFAILEYLAGEIGGASVTGISRALGINISTVHRILDSLAGRGYISQDDGRIYSLGLRFIELSASYLTNLDLKKEAEGPLTRLSSKLGMTVFLATKLDDEVVYIDRYEVLDGFRKYATIGERRPMYCTALGKTLLGGISPDELRLYSERTAFAARTGNTITDNETLAVEVAESVARGWSADDEELQEEICCRAVPVRDYRGFIIAAISVSGYRDVVAGSRETGIIGGLQRAADEISRNLGYDSGSGEGR